ncbi:MAG: hypothetical protein GQ540_03340 [Lutibacter sp.]|uniref:hypothetical protein n=1 Tax=Lutibacter sp. TaxID=1925666 RepID=UPI001A011B03|nr:hypothetical protein [Lutibacter sp.]NOR27546.1 hypothetical protein [Lutibacter sp.]
MELEKRIKRFMEGIEGNYNKQHTLQIENLFAAHILDQDKDTRHACAELMVETVDYKECINCDGGLK